MGMMRLHIKEQFYFNNTLNSFKLMFMKLERILTVSLFQRVAALYSNVPLASRDIPW